MSEANLELVEQAVSIASSIALCTAPPWGTVAGGVGLTIGALLNDFFPNTSPSAPNLQQIVATAVSQQFSQHDIQEAMNTITSVQNEFLTLTTDPEARQLLPKRGINATLKNDVDGVFSNLYNFLNREVTGEGRLVPAINSMTTESQGEISPVDGDLQAAYLPSFAYGVTAYLLLATYWASLISAVEPSRIQDTSLYAAVNYLTTTVVRKQTGWLNYFDKAFVAYEQAVASRLAQVNNGPRSGPGCVPFTYQGEFLDLITLVACYFSDQGESVGNFYPQQLHFTARYHDGVVKEVYFPGDIGTQPKGANKVVFVVEEGRNESADQAPFMASCSNMRSQYIDLMRQTLYANYIDPSRLIAIASPWQKGLGMLRTALAQKPH